MRCKWYQVVVFLSFPYFLHTPPSPLHVCFPCVCFIGRKLEGSVHFGSPSTSCGGSPSECLQGSVCKTKNWSSCKKKDKKTSNENRFVSLIPIWVILMRFLMRLLCQKDFVETKRYAFHGCWLFGPQAFHGKEPLFTNYALSGSQTEPFVATLDA